jgi:hypothetical protein
MLSRIFHLKSYIQSKNFWSFASIFKGSGIQFYQTKKYEIGDPTKHINWKASSKQWALRTNLFSEEKELHIDLFLDINYNWTSTLTTIHQRCREFLHLCKRHGARITLYEGKNQKISSHLRNKHYASGELYFSQIAKKIERMLPIYSSSYHSFLIQSLQQTKKRSIVLISDFLSENTETQHQLQKLQELHNVYLVPISINPHDGQNY